MKTLIVIMCLAASVSFGRCAGPDCLPCAGNGCGVNRPYNTPAEHVRTIAVVEAEILVLRNLQSSVPPRTWLWIMYDLRIMALEDELLLLQSC